MPYAEQSIEKSQLEHYADAAIYLPTENKETTISDSPVRFKAVLSAQIWCEHCYNVGGDDSQFDDRVDTFSELIDKIKDHMKDHNHGTLAEPEFHDAVADLMQSEGISESEAIGMLAELRRKQGS